MKAELQRQFAYRYDIATYVPGNFFELSSAFILWTIIYRNTEIIGGYSYPEMVTYIIIGWIFSLITTNYNYENIISRDINLGKLTNYLSKPISYLKFTGATAVARVGVAIFYIILQGVIYFFLFKDIMLVDVGLSKVLILIVMAIFAFLIKLFIAILIGMVSFWLVEISGLFAFADIFVKFFSGTFFPMVLLPASLLKAGYFLPFVYTFFVPVQFFLDKISTKEALWGVAVQMIWLAILYLIIKIVWKYGLKRYEAYGS